MTYNMKPPWEYFRSYSGAGGHPSQGGGFENASMVGLALVMARAAVVTKKTINIHSLGRSIL